MYVRDVRRSRLDQESDCHSEHKAYEHPERFPCGKPYDQRADISLKDAQLVIWNS